MPGLATTIWQMQSLVYKIWNNSPRHRALLPRIKRIVIVGRVAVGRG